MGIQNILVATDLERSDPIEYAFSLAESLGARVHVLYAYPPIVVPNGHGFGSIPYETLHQRALEQVRAQVQPLAQSRAMGRCLAKLGDPLTVVLDTAHALEIDLIVLGTHGRQGLQRLLNGSVAEAVLREAPVPVLVVKGPEALASQQLAAS